MGKRKSDAPSGDRVILVPVDFSPDAEAALLFGSTLATALAAKLLVLHVVHDPGEAPGYYRVKGRKSVLRRLEDVASEMLEEFLQRVRAEHPEATALKKARRELVVGLPVTRILEVVEARKPLMVVMGSTGRTGLARALLGSKVEQTMRLCPVPVTVVKSPRPEKKKDAKKHGKQDEKNPSTESGG